jgi:hypothetical protein
MTKAQEIKLLEKTIEKFGKDSYLGPWLIKYKERIEWAIRNDFPVETALVMLV